MLIRSGKEDVFIAGADINEFTRIHTREEAEQLAERGQRVFNKLSKLPFPTIAIIHGPCLGGGLEFALSCDYRITSDHPKTKIGLPEVNLGIIPAWGGTQRMPRLLGLSKALPLILAGRAVNAAKAHKLGLADALISHEFLEEGIKDFLKKVFDKKEAKKIKGRRRPSGFLDCILERNPIGRQLIYMQAKKNILSKTHGHYPAPLAALDTIKGSYSKDLNKGLGLEAKNVGKLFENPVAQNLISLFFTDKDLKKEPPTEQTLKKIEKIGVLGAGVMGGGIAWLFSQHQHPVRLKDISLDAIAKGLEAAKGMFDQLQKRRKMRPWESNLKMHLISGATDYSGFEHSDLVVEAIVENLDIKKKVLKELESKVEDDTIICSNTSSLRIQDMAEALEKPERFIGMHFFNPVNRMPLVEIVPGPKTSPETTTALVKLVKKLGKTPIVVGDCAGFLVNRILIPSLDEAGHIFEEGFHPEFVDDIMEEFGMPMGPFRLGDEVGLDVSAKVGKQLEQAYGERMRLPKVFEQLPEKKFIGRKTGTGFYIYKGKNRKFNQNVLKLQKHSKQKKSSGNEDTEKEIIQRIVFIMLNEATRCLDEKIVENPEHLDMAMIMGTGFPPFRGGLLRYADSIGISNVVSQMQKLASKYGERFQPTKMLTQMDLEGRTFYTNK